MSFTVEIKGLRELQAKLDDLPNELRKEASAILENGAKIWVALAKRDAPVNFGVLRNEINYAKVGDLSFEVVSNAQYSPYLEWGTLTNVFKGYPNLTPEIEAYAATFWTHSKRKGGIYPHPFFFKQEIPVVAQIERGLQGILNEIKL